MLTSLRRVASRSLSAAPPARQLGFLLRPSPPTGIFSASRRCLCSKPGGWDANSAVHGTPQQPADGSSIDEASFGEPGGPKGPAAADTAAAEKSRLPPRSRRPALLSANDKADMLQFQVYVRQRLGEMNKRLPARPSTREAAELAFLEDEVIQDHMPRVKRKLRDPLREIKEEDIVHTNLNLLSRFVSEAGSILPRKLTGVSARKQKKLEKAIKRAHQLALMPRTWKLPRYRHASYADQYSLPERPPAQRPDDDEFRDPPDIRFPNQWERARSLDIDLTKLVRAGAGMKPQGKGKLGS